MTLKHLKLYQILLAIILLQIIFWSFAYYANWFKLFSFSEFTKIGTSFYYQQKYLNGNFDKIDDGRGWQINTTDDAYFLYEYLYKNGEQQGEYREYNNKMMLTDIMTYRNDVMNGLHSVFFKDGERYIVESRRHGKVDGCYLEWWRNGVLCIKGKYGLDKPVGKWQWWDKSGKPILESTFVNGTGVMYSFNGDGLAGETFLKEGLKHGRSTLYNIDGYLMLENRWYIRDQKITENEFKNMFPNDWKKQTHSYLNMVDHLKKKMQNKIN